MKQRLVGILVFSCLLLLAWHLVFSNEAPRPVDTRSQIPPPPKVQASKLETPQKPAFASRPAPAAIPADAKSKVIEVSETQAESASQSESQPESKAASSTASSIKPSSTSSSGIRPKPSTAPSRDESTGLPLAWGVQLTALADKSVAKALVRDLKADGYQAFLRELKRSSGVLYRVIIGPKINQDDAERLRKEVEKRYQRFQPMIVRFER